jgi:hypothetical protein
MGSEVMKSYKLVCPGCGKHVIELSVKKVVKREIVSYSIDSFCKTYMCYFSTIRNPLTKEDNEMFKRIVINLQKARKLK